MSRYLRIGLFVALSSTALIIYVMQTAEVVGNGNSYTIHAYVDDASGLVVDSVVTLAGVTVGRLTAIELDGERARLTLEIREDVELTEDAAVSKVTQSLLGGATVALRPGSGQGAPLTSGGVVRNVQQAASINDAVGSANDLAASAADLVQEVNRFLQEEGTIDSLNEIVATVQQTAVTTSQLLEENLRIARSTMENIQSFSARLDEQSVQQLARVQEILDSTARLTANLDSLVGSNDESLGTSIRSIEQNLARLENVLASLETTAGNVERITQVVRDGEGNVGRLINDDELYDRALSIADQAESFLDSTVGLGVQVGFRSEFLTQQLDTRDQFELRLLPASDDKYYTAGVVSTPVPRSVTREVTTTTTGTGANASSVPSPQNTVSTTTTRTNDLKLNLQLARIWGPLTVRAGVFESTAGVGLDLAPIDQLEVSAEAYEFGAENGAYIRGYGTLYPFYNPDSSNPLQWFYLAGGVDDALNIYSRDYFVGAGVRFTDQDLRGLVGFIPIN